MARFQLMRSAWLPMLPLLLAGCGVTSKMQNANGVRLYQQAFYQGAAQRFQQAIHSDQRNANAYYNLAATYHQLGKLNGRDEDFAQAESYYNLCLDRQPNHTDCHRALAVLLIDDGRDDAAFRLMEGWTARSPWLADPKIELARLHDEFGEREAAQQYLTEAVALEPANARALAALGRIREELGDRTQALADYQRSLYHNRFQPEVAARVASLQASLGPAPLVTPSAVGTRTVDGGRATQRLR